MCQRTLPGSAPACTTVPMADSHAETFLRALDPNPDAVFTFMALNGDKSRVFTGVFVQHEAELRRLNADGYGIYLMVNGTDGQSILQENVNHVRAWFTEVDYKQLAPMAWKTEWSYPADLPPPSIVVLSAHGPHMYWLPVNGRIEDHGEWTTRQRAIRRILGGDPKVGRLNQMMRMPGFWHKSGDLVQCIVTNAMYTPEAMANAFQAIPSDAPESRTATLADPVRMTAEELAWAKAEISAILEKRDPDRNDGSQQSWTYTTCLLVADYLPNTEDAMEVLRAWNARSTPPLSDSDLRVRWEHAVKYRTKRLGTKVGDKQFENSLEKSWVETEDRTPKLIEYNPFNVGPTLERVGERIATHPNVYQWEGKLVFLYETPRPPSVERTGPTVIPHNNTTMRSLIESRCRFFTMRMDKKTGQTKPVHIPTPPDVVAGLLADPQLYRHVRPLRRIVTTPVIGGNGNVVRPGYDPTLGIVYHPIGELPDPPENPTHADALAARDALLDTVCDFPFETAASKASWLAMVLTPFAQWVYGGRAPFFLVTANTPGAGKGLLVDVMMQVCFGRSIPPITMDFEDDAEVNKQLVSIVMEQKPVVLVDNIDGNVGGPVFDMAATSPTLSGRVLGRSQVVEGPMDFLWIGTGNNVGIKGDAARRLCIIRLATPLERPENRANFRHGNHAQLREYVKEHRAALVKACLTIWRAWYQAGRPDMDVSPWGTFDGWSRWVRSCVKWLRMPDPKDACASVVSVSDNAVETFRDFLEAFHAWAPDGASASDLIVKTSTPMATPEAQKVWRLITELVGTNNVSIVSLGRRLAQFRGRVMSGRELKYHRDEGARKWVVEIHQPLTQSAG